MAAKKECTLRPPEPEAQDEKEVAAEGWTQRPPPLYWVLLTRAWSLRTTARQPYQLSRRSCRLSSKGLQQRLWCSIPMAQTQAVSPCSS
jgi:hypothetical protein